MDKWLLWSDRGEGKTSAMVQMANDLNDCGYKVTFVSATEETLHINRDINHIFIAYELPNNTDYTLAVLKEKARLGRIDFLIIDDIEMTGFNIIATLEIPCNMIISASSFGSGPIKEMVPVSLIGKENFIEISSEGELSPKDYRFNQTFDSNKSIKYSDIINRYLRDKKLEQLI